MKRRFDFEDQVEIVIRGRRAEDIVWVVLAVTLFGLNAWAIADVLLGREKLDETLLFLVLLWPLAIVGLIAPVSRLWNRKPFFQADTEGLRLHPGFWPRALPWSDIRSLSIRTDPFGGNGAFSRNGMIRVLLRTPQRTAAYPFGTREIRLPLRMLDLSRKDGANLLRRLKQLRALRCPDLDAAD